MLLNSKFHAPHSREAQATLSLVFLIGGIIIMAGVSMAFLMVTFVNSGFGFQAANQAAAAAAAGANDAIIQLNRNKDFASIGYSVPVNGASATVTVSQNTPTAGQVTIISEAGVSQRKRKIQAVMSVSSSTGQVDLLSWQQLTL